MTPPSTPIDAHDAVARHPRIATPLNLLIVLASVFVAVVWLITLQRIAFEREQALTAEMKANSSLAIAFEQQVFRALKAAEQVAAFVREQYRRQGKAIDLRRWVEEGIIREEMFTIVSVVDEQGISSAVARTLARSTTPTASSSRRSAMPVSITCSSISRYSGGFPGVG